MSDNEHRRKDDKISVVEKHAQSIVAMIVMGLLTWTVITVNATDKTTAVMKAQMNAFQEQLAVVQTQVAEGVGDRYRASDAKHDFGVVYEALGKLTGIVDEIRGEQNRRGPRIRGLEDRVKNLESDHFKK